MRQGRMSRAAHPVLPPMLRPSHWDRQYQGEPIWHTGKPCQELQRVLRAHAIAPRRAVEFGCGRGVNAIWLARQGVHVTANDLSPVAIEYARRKARELKTPVDWRVGDLRDLPDDQLRGQCDFIFDRGCYHVVRQVDPEGYLRTLLQLLRRGGLVLLLTGNAREPEDTVGPPVVAARDLMRELGAALDVLALTEFRWDARPGEHRYLGWSCLLRRRSVCEIGPRSCGSFRRASGSREDLSLSATTRRHPTTTPTPFRDVSPNSPISDFR